MGRQDAAPPLGGAIGGMHLKGGRMPPLLWVARWSHAFEGRQDAAPPLGLRWTFVIKIVPVEGLSRRCKTDSEVGIAVDQLPVNPLLARGMYMRGYIEHVGSGTGAGF